MVSTSTDNDLLETPPAALRPSMEDILNRRVAHAVHAVSDRTHVKFIRPAWWIDSTDEFLHISVYPYKEHSNVLKRAQKFATAFPGLFSISGRYVRYDRTAPMAYIGALSIPKTAKPMILIGDPEGSSIMVGDCFFDMQPDSRLILQNMSFRKIANRIGEKVFRYRIYMSFIFVYGESITRHNIRQIAEDTIVDFLYSAAIAERHVSVLSNETLATAV